jgi:hypothetical protein
MEMFLDRMMRPPFIVVSINWTLTSGTGVLLSVIRVAWVIRHAPQLPGAYGMVRFRRPAGNPDGPEKKNERSFLIDDLIITTVRAIVKV